MHVRYGMSSINPRGSYVLTEVSIRFLCHNDCVNSDVSYISLIIAMITFEAALLCRQGMSFGISSGSSLCHRCING